MDEHDAHIPLERQLCFALYSASRTIQQAYKPILTDMGITFPQYLVLVTLWDQDDRTVSQIGHKLQLDSNTLTPLLKRMEAMGLVVRTRDAADERQVRLRLTGAGRDLRARAGEFVDCVVSKTGLSVAELESLQARITLLRDRLRGCGDPDPEIAS